MDEMMMRDETAEKVLEAVEAQRKATTTRTSSRFTASRGGHAPGHLREAFESWVEDGATAETVAVGYDETVVPLRWLIGQLWNCSDIMPSGLCDQLDMRSGSTYAQAARAVAEVQAEKALQAEDAEIDAYTRERAARGARTP